MQILDGKSVSTKLYGMLQQDAASLKEKGVNMKLVIIQVGEDPASSSYIRSKQRACEQVGVTFEHKHFGADEVTTESLIEKIHALNKDESVTGILVQLPLPSGIYEPDVIKAIAPGKDVDGLTAYNMGKTVLNFEELAPCTPLGIVRLLEHYGVEVEGKEAVVVGRSNIVGKPAALMLLNRGATVTVCHSKTADVAAHTRRADILVVAVGKPGFVTADMVKEGAVIIDVGINRIEAPKQQENGSSAPKKYRLVGDVAFDEVKDKASFITPVPGGCGLMTVACLLENVVKAAKKQHNLS